MLLVSSRRCMVLLTALLFVWVVFIGTIVTYPPESLTAYTSKIGIGRGASGVSSGNSRAGNAREIPQSWLKDTRFLSGTDRESTRPAAATNLEKTAAVKDTHNEVFSHTTPDGAFFRVDFGAGNAGINPNVIPHPYDPNLWIAVAQEFHGLPSDDKPVTPWSVEMVCNANFTDDGTLRCNKSPSILPIAATPTSPNCPPDLEVLNLSVGPHDARVFYGPGIPYTTFGSQSRYSCMGQFIQDFRYLTDWGMFRRPTDTYFMATDIQKPNAGPMEKNFFVFWDLDGSRYAHYDVHPERIFSRLGDDGTAGRDLAPRATGDHQCWQKHLALNPLPTDIRASIHQATNSLAITLCNRVDPACQPTTDNTFLFHIYQHKLYTDMFRSRYEPFVALFRPTAPFALHAISAKPLWIHGRRDASQMLYITAVSWKTHGQTYQGFLDDPLFVTFGIDDHDTGAIDVTAGDLLGELMDC